MMTAADIPAIPPQSVEVCEHMNQTVCPVVTVSQAIWVTGPSEIAGGPEVYGRLVRFVSNAFNGDPGAWVRMSRGGEVFFALRDLTLVAPAASVATSVTP